MLLGFQADIYNMDHIALLVSFLPRQSAEWVLRSDSDVAHSYPEFCHHFKGTFQHTDSEVETDLKLYHLRKRERPLSKYMAEFWTLAVQEHSRPPSTRGWLPI